MLETPQTTVPRRYKSKIGEIFTTVFMLIVVMLVVRSLHTAERMGTSYEAIFKDFDIKLSVFEQTATAIQAFLYRQFYLVATLLAMLISGAMVVTWRGNWLVGVIVGAALLVLCTAYDLVIDCSLRSLLSDILGRVHPGAP